MVDTAQLAHVETLRDKLPEAAKDLRLNLQAVFRSQALSSGQVWGVALASAYFVGCEELRDALLADAQAEGVDDGVIEDAKASASLMSMNTVYYRFRHMVDKDGYQQRAAQLRMSRMAKPATSKGDMELFSMACAVLAGCETCIKAHENSIRKHELSEEHVHETVRIAAVINGVAAALRM